MISSDVPLLSVDDLADQVAEVLDFFGYVKCFLHLLCLPSIRKDKALTFYSYLLQLIARKQVSISS